MEILLIGAQGLGKGTQAELECSPLVFVVQVVLPRSSPR
jgi:hypothetical protein